MQIQLKNGFTDLKRIGAFEKRAPGDSVEGHRDGSGV